MSLQIGGCERRGWEEAGFVPLTVMGLREDYQTHWEGREGEREGKEELGKHCLQVQSASETKTQRLSTEWQTDRPDRQPDQKLSWHSWRESRLGGCNGWGMDKQIMEPPSLTWKKQLQYHWELASVFSRV